MRFGLAAALVLAAVVCRVMPHPWNFAPVGAIALFAGAAFDRRWAAFLVPLVAMFAGDTLLELTTGRGYHSLMLLIYATYALIVVVGMYLRERRGAPLYVAAGALGSSTIFFVVSNLGVWAGGTLYPKTFEGLVACYVAALPFFERTVVSDLLFSAVLFSILIAAERRVAAFAPVRHP